MTPDPLDDLLDRSAPAIREAADGDLRAMIARASRASRRRRRTIGFAAGALAVVLVGGAGMAAATDGFTWAPWAQDPVGVVDFTMENGLHCELRFTRYVKGADPAFLGEVNGVLEDWYRTSDVAGLAKARLPQTIVVHAVPDLELAPGETAASLTPGELEHRRFDREWMVWQLTIDDLEMDELARHGIQARDGRFGGSERASGIKCLDASGKPYMPGAGS